jgi:diacylglycerol O-acyltransferase / wax synthase
MDRLSTLDAEFLHLEDGIAHMHIAGACIFSDPPPTYEEVAHLIESKFHLIPRYRQRVRSVPFELGRPIWVDDPHFDLQYHLRHTALPGDGDDATFNRLMGRLMSQPLDRERPLWETWLVEGLADGHWALVFKVHHCMVDGIAGVQLLGALLDLEPEPEPTEPLPWEAEPEPPGAVKVLDAWGGFVSDTVETVRDLPRVVTQPSRAARTVVETASGLARYVTGFTGNEPLSLAGSIGPHRTWASSKAELADVKRIRQAFGGTVNDVVLAAVSGGYRELLRSRGENPDDAVVTTMVPVSTRHDDGRGVPDNRVSMLLYELPVDIADPVERLTLVSEQMSQLKHSHMAEAGERVTRMGDLVPPMVIGAVTRVAIRAVHRLPQRAINTVTTNVPGPQFPLYCLGREMLEYRPYVPISHGVRVGTAILSYNGALSFGVTGDQATASDVAVLADAIPATIDELLTRAAGRLGEAVTTAGAKKAAATKKAGAAKTVKKTAGANKSAGAKKAAAKKAGAKKTGAKNTAGTKKAAPGAP